MKLFFLTLSIVLGLSLGSLFGLVFLKQLPTYPISRHSNINQIFGVWRHEVIGFLPYWLINKADGDYSQSITTLTYFGLGINPDGSIQQKTNPKENEPGWTALKNSTALHAKLADAKKHGIDLSLLVEQMDADKIDQLLSDPVNHAHKLVSEVEPIMFQYGFTDLNLDLETFEIASPAAQQKFTAFVKTIKQDMTKKNLGTVSIDLIASSLIKPYLTDPKSIGESVDKVIFMTYDYHYAGSWVTGPVAPLGGAGISTEFDVQTVIEQAPKVIPVSKLVLGIPLYGYEWETLSTNPIAAVVPGSGRTATHERIIQLLNSCTNCKTGSDSLGIEPYILFPDNNYYHSIYYEDTRSISEKLKQISTWKGTALWALGYEANHELLSPLEPYLKEIHLLW